MEVMGIGCPSDHADPMLIHDSATVQLLDEKEDIIFEIPGDSINRYPRQIFKYLRCASNPANCLQAKEVDAQDMQVDQIICPTGPEVT